MKPATVVAVSLALCVYLAPRGEGQNRSGKSTNKPTTQNDAPGPSAIPVPYYIENQLVNAETQHREREPSPWYKSPEWMLVIFGGITFSIIGWQSFETHRAATASQNAANAALLNAKALIISERPWLLVSIQESKTSPDEWIVQARNAGRTPAEIKEGHCVCNKHPVLFTGPSDALSDPFWLPMQNLIVNKDSFAIRTIAPEAQITQDDRNGFSPAPSLFVYGWVSYWDTFTDRAAPGAEPAITSWIFRYDSSDKKFHRVAGAYTKNT